MESYKCTKYINKLAITSIDDPKFGIYLNKLMHWHSQIGGNIDLDNLIALHSSLLDKLDQFNKIKKNSSFTTQTPNQQQQDIQFFWVGWKRLYNKFMESLALAQKQAKLSEKEKQKLIKEIKNGKLPDANKKTIIELLNTK